MKHIKTSIIAFLCALAGTAWADTETLGGYEFTIETDGEGSYYKVDCPAALDAIATYVNSNNSHTCSGKTFRQTANITYSHTTDWNDATSTENNYTAIGSENHLFKGTYDGQGHTISGIRIYKSGNTTSDENQGIFGITGGGAVIRGITLADARITGYTATGGIVGYMYTGGTTVSDCHVAANVAIRAYKNNASCFGGIVGGNYSGNISYCTSAATIVKDDASIDFFGGIVGDNRGTLSHNLAIGAVVPAGKDNNHGAICGRNNGGTLSHNNYYHCTVAGVENATDVGCKNADITTNNGAVPGIILYDNSSNTDINSYILTTVGNAAVSRVELAGRTLYKDDKWNTLCLPFDVTVGSGQMEGATAMTLNASTSGFNASMGVLTLNFTSVATGNTIAAGTPFIVKWTGSNVTDPVFTGVTIDNSIEAVARKTVTSSDNKVQFIGSYNTVPLTGSDKSNLYLGDGNNLYWPSDDVTLGAFRAYFHMDLTGSVGIKEFVLNFGEDDADGIDRPTPDPTRDGGEVIFNLAGQRLQKMQKGININKGKKIIIK